MKISVITAVFNGRETISRTIESLIAQDYPGIEYIVVDGDSTDGTLKILERYRSHIDILISERDNGIYDALNKGLRMATGDAIAILHSDDFLAGQDVLSRIARTLQASEADAVYADLVYVGRYSIDTVIRYWKAGEFSRPKLAFGWMPPHPTLCVRRSLYERIGGFDDSFDISADYDMILRLFSLPDVRMAYIPHVTVKMRVGGVSNRSLRELVKKSKEDLRAIRKNHIGGYFTLVCKNVSKIPQFFWRR
ncbi:glycosyltransferase [Burkholderia mayonis]|uniref:Glycosyltransferase n=1 Tax=Burkholderia mayonis TaxID=1385591 RepID=A0A1B4FQ62_9BURK|nr:glycosyltransferase [Burkholderia mayonis]KVE36897.1 glycosyltransferase [Burkholderia sp. BDU5]KVE41357.1 glycosyltransferase [Burkholderia mayonis]